MKKNGKPAETNAGASADPLDELYCQGCTLRECRGILRKYLDFISEGDSEWADYWYQFCLDYQYAFDAIIDAALHMLPLFKAEAQRVMYYGHSY
ncbi:MAG: hypothetical protein LUE27_06495 [Clostridia bacterium]|nr:hypothetical protein [Clostridia bacterium]